MGRREGGRGGEARGEGAEDRPAWGRARRNGRPAWGGRAGAAFGEESRDLCVSRWIAAAGRNPCGKAEE